MRTSCLIQTTRITSQQLIQDLIPLSVMLFLVFQDWSDPASLALILNISKGCFHDTDNIVGSLFTNFIANKLDKLVSPEDMLLQGWDTVSKKIEKCVWDGDQYHPEIAAVLHTRLLNYAQVFWN